MISVIKLGGSLLTTQTLPSCLEVVEHIRGKVLIVPGGGVFADQVRSAQKQWTFDDHAAHRMAILAMQQMALLFHSLKPNFDLMRRVSEFASISKVAIWSPDPDELDAAGVTPSWDITSDSLAAWLAGQVRADRLLLVKSCPVQEAASIFDMQAQGIVDACFSHFSTQLACKISILNKEHFLSIHDEVH